MKYVGVGIVMALGFLFLPWWATYILGVLMLIFVPGYVPLIFIILLDFFSLPQEFPYASVIFLVFMGVSYVIKDRMFDGVV